MKKLFIAEKPSQMRSLVSAFEANAKKKHGYYEGNDFIFTNAIGHLLGIKNINKGEKWDIQNLPLLLNIKENKIIDFYEVKEDTKEQFDIIQKILERKDIEEIICATDPDAEGEAIYRTIIEKIGNITIKQTRLIIKDTTKEGLNKQFTVRKDITDYEGLRQRAYARAIADFTLGINLTQAVSIKSKTLYHIGRVQSPTLKMIVDRYRLNTNHTKTLAYKIEIKNNFYNFKNNKLKFATKEMAKQFLEKINSLNNLTINFEKNVKRKAPPKLYDLADIQKYGNEKLNLSTDQTLQIVQELYEKGFISYPRTDCKFITKETADILNKNYGGNTFESLKLNQEVNKNVIGIVTAHEGLTPTPASDDLSSLNEVQYLIFQEIKIRFLANYLDDLEFEETKVTINEVEGFTQVFKKVIKKGYLDLYNDFNEKKIPDSNGNEILDTGELCGKIIEVESTPKPLFTESSLLSKMQNIHLDIEEEELKKLSKEMEGIGTPATRSSIIKSLFERDYITLKKKLIVPTEKGINLVTMLEEMGNPLINAEYTAKIEKSLKNVEKKLTLVEFCNTINEFTNSMVNSIKNKNLEKYQLSQKSELGECPKCGRGKIIKIITKKKDNFYPCTNRECDFNFGVVFKFSEKDVINLLHNKKTRAVTLKNKEGKRYKCKFYLKKNKIEREFLSKGSNEPFKKRK